MLTPIRQVTPAPASTADGNRSAAGPAGSDFALHLRAASATTRRGDASSAPSPDESAHVASAGGTSAASASSGGGSTASGGSTSQHVLRPHGEKLEHVPGHHYARIADGPDSGMFLNQLAGNPRKDEAFRVVERNGRTFHVYGQGRSEVVEEIGKHGPGTGGTPAATS